MRRFPQIKSLAAGLMLAAPGAFCALHQGNSAPVNYWPFRDGKEWKLLLNGPGGPSTLTYTVRSVQQSRGSLTATLTVLHESKIVPKVTTTEVYRSDASGIALVSDGYGTYNPPIPITQPDMAKGKKWNWSGTMGLGRGSGPASAEMECQGPEEVVAYGPSHQKFIAMKVWIKIKRTVQGKDHNQEFGYGFAPSVGLVEIRTGFMTAYTLVGN